MKSFYVKKEKHIHLFKLLFLLFALPLFLNSNHPGYANNNEDSSPSNLKVGLALSGGGARGIAHIGVIIALEENNIPINMIAGTSMGSIVGGLYAAGYSGKEMREIVNRIDWDEIFNQDPDPKLELISKRYGMMEPVMRLRFRKWELYLPFGLMNGQRVSEMLFRYTAAANFAAKSNFDSLTIPFRAMAVDLSTAELITLRQGSLSQAIRASMAIPLVFHPAIVDNRILVDGGVLNILPTDVVKEMGADVIIACDLEGLFPLGKEPKHLADVAIHTLDVTIRELKKKQIALADVLIEPALGNYSSYDYSNPDSLVKIGYEAAMARMDKIKKIISDNPHKPHSSKRHLNTGLVSKARIKQITVIGNDRVRLPVITGEFPLKKDDTFDPNLALRGVKNIYATGLFENVWLELDYLTDDLVGINIHVIEKYPRTIGFGVNYRTDEGMSGFIQIVHFNFFGWGERFMPLIRIGDLHKRVGLEIVNDRFFATPITVHNGIYYERERPYIYNSEGEKADYLKMDRVVAQFSVGIQPYRKFLLNTGIRGERVWLGKNQYHGFGAATLKHWSAFGEIVFDNTDDRYFPRKGLHLFCNGESIVEFKQNARPFTKFFGQFDGYFSPNPSHTMSIHLFAGTSVNGLPIYEQFRLGGPFDVPGYHRDELWGNHAISMQLKYRVKVFKKWHFESALSLASIDKDTDFIKGVSSGLVAASPIGPIKLIYGWSDNHRQQFYFSAGYNFH